MQIFPQLRASLPRKVRHIFRWIVGSHPSILRLYSLGYVDDVFLDLRPWTRASVSTMLKEAGDRIDDADQFGDATTAEARAIYDAVSRELDSGTDGPTGVDENRACIESVYSVARAISGTPLRDSFHLGSTIVNDYGRPYEAGFNNYSGASGYATAGRFVLYVRGEFQGAPSATGYSTALAQALSTVDGTIYTDPATQLTNYYLPQATIPMGPISTAAHGRFLEAYVSAQLLNHVFSFGKQDDWLGPAEGGSTLRIQTTRRTSTHSEINRIEPLYVPVLSRFIGPIRYEFLTGPLQGHTLIPNPAYVANPSPTLANVINPGNPWVHLEKIRISGPRIISSSALNEPCSGATKGHSPVNLHSFLKSFFSTASPSGPDKNGPNDPGARFAAFDLSYRLPFARNWLTLYTDSEVHDDVSPIDAPRRAAYRPGIYLSHVPRIPKLDFRVEAAYTDPSNSTVQTREYGRFMYYEQLEKQGYTNQGQLFGDWIGREDKGGQAWITWHLSGNEWIQINERNQKATKDFIPGSTTQTFTGAACPAPFLACLLPGGTTINDTNFQVVKRIGKDFRNQRQLRGGALEGPHLSSRLTDGDHHQHPVHLVSGTARSTSSASCCNESHVPPPGAADLTAECSLAGLYRQGQMAAQVAPNRAQCSPRWLHFLGQ